MANQTGTFVGSTDLLNKLNSFLIANGWTNLEGETDIVPASPKSARYWRILVLETEDLYADFREIELMEWRTTAGGANVASNGASYSFSNLASGTGSDLVSGTNTVQSSDINDDWWTVTYDFGVGTIIRELTIKCNTDNYAPKNFFVQWSHDNEVWTTMDYYDNLVWIDNETKTFTWDTGGGFTHVNHPSSTVARRSGYSSSSYWSTEWTKYSEMSDNIWTWQGPGFDAARRVYISSINWSDGTIGDDHIRFSPHTEYDASHPRSTWFTDQIGSPENEGIGSTYLVVDTSSGTYWFFLNNTRLFIVTKKGISDYTSAYIGFMSQFAQPDDYPFPLYVGATTDDLNETLTSTNADIRDAVDPGNNGKAMFRRWDNTWKYVTNHDGDSGRINDPVRDPNAWTWPFHTGNSGRNAWPDNTIGDYVDWDAHFLDRIDPTVQGDLPFIPVIVMDRVNGNVGALDGIFCVPRGGVLSPEQVITIAAVNYRVFNTRSKVNGMNFYAVRED